MRQIILKTTKVTNSQVSDDFELSYKREFLRIVEVIPEGATTSQMGAALKIQKKLQDAPEDGKVYLEDAEWEFLRSKLTAEKFRLVCLEIVEMVNAVADAKEVEAPHLKAVGKKEPREATA